MNALHRVALILFSLIWLVSVAGCGEDDAIIPAIEEEELGTPATLDIRIERNNEFAIDLFHELAGSDDNLIISPHSIVTCVGMAYAGARGNTERQIADVMNFNYPQRGFHSALKQLNDLLVGRPYTYFGIANGCWGADSLSILTSYTDTLSTAYGADLDILDFAGHPEDARYTINQWVKDNTYGYIGDLFPPGSFGGSTYLVLANAMTFMAEWLEKFNPDYTHPGTFTKLDASTVTVDYMPGEGRVPYYDGPGYLAMEKLYKGEKFSMVFILPDEGQYKSFESGFDAAVLDSIVGLLEDRIIVYSLPKFGFYSAFNLGPTLQAMGMTDAFEPGVADFSGMDGIGIPWIGQVVHKAYIEINEWGTIAFAGTGMELSVGIHDPFYATRPFIYAIRDIETGTILFVGRVLDPTQR
jgi:serpin B